MSGFASGVVGVFVVGMIAGVGALMLIPQSSPSAMRFADPPARPCGQQTWPATDRICQKWTAPSRDAHAAGSGRKQGAIAPAELTQQADAQTPAQSEPRGVSQPAAAVLEKPRVAASASRSAQNARVAQRPKAEGLQAVQRFGDNLIDLRASAYAPDGPGRAMAVRPAARPGVARGNGFFPLFR
jgi:hypothetical protein